MIQCYVIQVMTGEEETYIKHAVRNVSRIGKSCKLLLPRREMTIRRKAKLSKQIKPIFPGYVFWETEVVDTEVRTLLRRSPNYIRFMKEQEGSLIPLKEDDRQMLSSIMSDGQIARKSYIYFDENNRVRVLKGPLKGYEGNIIRVDRRKKRATVEIRLYDKRFKIDLEYEQMERPKRAGESSASAESDGPSS